MYEAVSGKFILFFKRFNIILVDKINIYRKKNPASIIGPCFHIFSSEELPQRMIPLVHAIQDSKFDSDPLGHAWKSLDVLFEVTLKE